MTAHALGTDAAPPADESACLSESELLTFLRGAPSGAAAARLEQHIDACPACHELLILLSRALPAEPAAETPEEAPPPPQPLRGERIQRFVLLSMLGAGGMGVVYAAYDPDLARKVALKLLRGPGDELSQTWLAREAQALARLAHPNVIAVHDIGRHAEQLFIVMELVEGETLGDWLAAAPRPAAAVLAVMRQAGSGLLAAHQAGLVHRDFKPSNVLIGRDGRVRVGDFGLARRARELGGRTLSGDESPAFPPADTAVHGGAQPSLRTQSGLLVGTPLYMAPEQYLGKESDARSDQFSFCVVLYEALYGARPFAGDSFEELRRAVVSGELAPRRSKSAGVPSYVEQALARGLAADPGARFAHMGALLSALTPKPHPLYRLSALGLIVALLLALGGLGDRALHEKKRRSCVQAEALPAGIWDEAQRREVRRAFLATAKPYSLAAWQKVEQLLSDYTASWVVERAEACHATRVRGEQPVEVMALRERCLDQRREELAALLEVFTHADAEVVENAVRAVQSLPSSAACADVAALRARHPPPERNDAREPSPLRGLKRELLQVEALQRAGKSASAAAQAQALVERASALGTRHLEALAWVQLGLAQGGQGSYDRAEQALRKGLLTAEASGDRVLCAQTWLHLANNALRRNRPLEVDEDLGHAAALAESLGGDGEFAARRLYLMAAREHTQAHYAAAAEHAQAALAAYEKLGRRTIEQSQAMWLLGVILEARGDYSAAADVLTRALRMVEAQLGPDHPQVTSYLNAIGSVKQNQGLPEDALPQYQRALRIKTAALGADHPDVGVQLSNQGMLLIRLGRLDEAQAALQRARGILEKSEGQSRIVLARTLKQIAKIHMQRRDYAQAAQSFERARALLVELLGPDHDDVARCLHDLSLLAMQRRQWALAAEQNRRALAIFERRLGPDHPHSAELYETLGEAYLQLGKFARAAAALTHAVIVMEKRKDTASELAGTRFLLARARWARNESGDRLAALALAGAAYAALPPDDENRSEIARWLARRQAG